VPGTSSLIQDMVPGISNLIQDMVEGPGRLTLHYIELTCYGSRVSWPRTGLGGWIS
jgi:hypothetical protein